MMHLFLSMVAVFVEFYGHIMLAAAFGFVIQGLICAITGPLTD